MILKNRIWPPFPYWGGKHYALHTILANVPDGTDRVIAPFIGGGSVEATLAANGVKVEGGDIFEPVANFWECATHMNAELRREIEEIGEPERDHWLNLVGELDDLSPLAQAAAFWVVACYSYAGMGASGGGYFIHPHRRFSLAVDKLRRFDGLPMSVDQAEFGKTLEWGADYALDALVYADPPYSGLEAMYGRKRDWAVIDQAELAYWLAPFERWILATDLTPEIRRLYRGARVVRLNHFNPGRSVNAGRRATATDVLLLSPGLARAIPRVAPLERL